MPGAGTENLMSPLTALLQDKASLWRSQHRFGGVAVAYSGGGDSLALADALVTSGCFSPLPLRLIHVNHQMHKDAGQWEEFCRQNARNYGVEFSRIVIEEKWKKAESPEAFARRVRYQAFARELRPAELLLSAHHLLDQAETVLLQLFRGAGPDGLRAMPEWVAFAKGFFGRPMLGVEKAVIREHLLSCGVQWLEDPANRDLVLDRSYLRQRLAPRIRRQWPAWDKTLARTAHHLGDLADVVREYAQLLLKDCENPDGTLKVQSLIRRSAAVQRIIVRQWLAHRNLPSMQYRQIEHLRRMFFAATQAPAGAEVRWAKGQGQVRHYRGLLYALQDDPTCAKGLHWTWPKGEDLHISETGQTLHRAELEAQCPGLDCQSVFDVRLRSGGEKVFHNKRIHKCLKKVFQELGVPPWRRWNIPLVYKDNDLVLIWGLKAYAQREAVS